MNDLKKLSSGKLFACFGIPIVFVLVILMLRFALYYFKSGGFDGMSMKFPLLVIGIVVFALFMSSFFSVWVYEDCKKRNDDGILWAIMVFVITPFLGLLIYLLRRSEIKKDCIVCGSPISLKAKYCEECGSQIKHKEEITDMKIQRTHHMKWIAMGSVCMILMLTCLITFIVSAAFGKGINTDVASNERVWNRGSISLNSETYMNGVWKLDFKKASDGFVSQKNMTVSQPKSECLYAKISCEDIPEGSSLTLYLIQNDVEKSFDVTNLSEPLVYPLTDFEKGKIHIRLLIDGVEDTVSEIYMASY